MRRETVGTSADTGAVRIKKGLLPSSKLFARGAGGGEVEPRGALGVPAGGRDARRRARAGGGAVRTGIYSGGGSFPAFRRGNLWRERSFRAFRDGLESRGRFCLVFRDGLLCRGRFCLAFWGGLLCRERFCLAKFDHLEGRERSFRTVRRALERRGRSFRAVRHALECRGRSFRAGDHALGCRESSFPGGQDEWEWAEKGARRGERAALCPGDDARARGDARWWFGGRVTRALL